MTESKRLSSFVTCFSIAWFGTWVFLLKETFFFHDEWTFLYSLITSPEKFIFSPHNGHFMPLFKFFYYTEYQLFKLNYFPYQILLLILNFVNGFLLYKIIRKIIKGSYFAALSLILFLTNSIYWEVLFSSSTLPTVLSLLFMALSLLLYLKFQEINKKSFLVFSAISSILAGLSWGAGVFFPFVIFLSLVIVRQWGEPIKKRILFTYFFSGCFSLVIYKMFVHNSIIINYQKIIIFWMTSVKWILVSFVTSSPGFTKLFLLIITASLFVLFMIIRERKKRAALLKVTSISKLPLILSALAFGSIYLITAISRYEIDMRLAESSRYTYIPLFFLIILFALFINQLRPFLSRNIKRGLMFYLLSLVVVNIYFYRIYYISWVETISIPNKKIFKQIINAKTEEELSQITFPSTFHSFYQARDIYFIYENSQTK